MAIRLGAAGVVETVVSLHSMLNNESLPTLGYAEHGVSEAVTVVRQPRDTTYEYCAEDRLRLRRLQRSHGAAKTNV